MTDKGKKRERIQITSIRNATRDITTDPVDTKNIRDTKSNSTSKDAI